MAEEDQNLEERTQESTGSYGTPYLVGRYYYLTAEQIARATGESVFEVRMCMVKERGRISKTQVATPDGILYAFSLEDLRKAGIIPDKEKDTEHPDQDYKVSTADDPDIKRIYPDRYPRIPHATEYGSRQRPEERQSRNKPAERIFPDFNTPEEAIEWSKKGVGATAYANLDTAASCLNNQYNISITASQLEELCLQRDLFAEGQSGRRYLLDTTLRLAVQAGMLKEYSKYKAPDIKE